VLHLVAYLLFIQYLHVLQLSFDKVLIVSSDALLSLWMWQ